jgi:hypothetical protein
MAFSGQDKLYPHCPEVKVGIGTTIPRVSLDVRGRTYLNKTFLGLADPNTINNNLYFHLKAPFESSVTDRTLFLIENGDRKLFEINNSGLVRAREIKIDVLSWADYVFEKDYPLMPIVELEQYIGLNGHLPNIPSEKEVLENGIDVAQMNQMLLEKIEELTMYVIDLQKQVNAQSSELELLKQ